MDKNNVLSCTATKAHHSLSSCNTKVRVVMKCSSSEATGSLFATVIKGLVLTSKDKGILHNTSVSGVARS